MRFFKSYPLGPAGIVGTVLGVSFLLYVDRTWGWDPEMFPVVFIVNVGLISLGHWLDRRFDTRKWLTDMANGLRKSINR